MPELNLAKEIGITATLVILLYISLQRSAVYLGKRFLDPDNGLLTLVARKHIEMIDTVKKNSDLQANESHRQSEYMREQAETMRVFADGLAKREAINSRRLRRTYKAQLEILSILKGSVGDKQTSLSETPDIQS